MKSKDYNLDYGKPLDCFESWDLGQFWSYAFAVMDAMAKELEEKDPDELPLVNKMTCIAYAALSFRRKRRWMDMEAKECDACMKFEEMYPDVEYSPRISEKATVFWYLYEDSLVQKLTKAGIDSREKFFPMTKTDFMKIGGIGKVSAEKLVKYQKTLAAYDEFAKKHANLIVDPDYEYDCRF